MFNTTLWEHRVASLVTLIYHIARTWCGIPVVVVTTAIGTVLWPVTDITRPLTITCFNQLAVVYKRSNLVKHDSILEINHFSKKFGNDMAGRALHSNQLQSPASGQLPRKPSLPYFRHSSFLKHQSASPYSFPSNGKTCGFQVPAIMAWPPPSLTEGGDLDFLAWRASPHHDQFEAQSCSLLVEKLPVLGRYDWSEYPFSNSRATANQVSPTSITDALSSMPHFLPSRWSPLKILCRTLAAYPTITATRIHIIHSVAQDRFPGWAILLSL